MKQVINRRSTRLPVGQTVCAPTNTTVLVSQGLRSHYRFLQLYPHHHCHDAQGLLSEVMLDGREKTTFSIRNCTVNACSVGNSPVPKVVGHSSTINNLAVKCKLRIGWPCHKKSSVRRQNSTQLSRYCIDPNNNLRF